MLNVSTLPAGFGWLSAACRPTPKEVEAYAREIARQEGEYTRVSEKQRREAELQLWIWRTENGQRTARRRRPS
jgi:hypothetical protein